jgi:2-polyprenyl-6-hydroxyphenyl methylase/3-demethylubiquinone-9 3-methyltransferase
MISVDFRSFRYFLDLLAGVGQRRLLRELSASLRIRRGGSRRYLLASERIGGGVPPAQQRVRKRSLSWIESLEQPYRSHVSTLKGSISSFIEAGMLPRTSIDGRDVIDLGCGLGGAAQIFSEIGANRVVGIDAYLDDNIDGKYPHRENVTYRKADFLYDLADLQSNIDLIFLNNASEHIQDMAAYLGRCFDVLRPSGCVFLAHDNYLQPVGHHDHGFLFLNRLGDKVETVAPQCWLTVEKCANSADYRVNLLELSPAVWSSELDAKRDPEACHTCPYYKRSQPWAHLLYQDEFNELFPFQMFRTLGEGFLNKITIRQLRQFAIEAGFQIDLEERFWLMNEINPALAADYAKHDLLTFQYILRLRKPG